MAGTDGKSGFGVVQDFQGSLKEESDFPILCETCLGENPYVRMQRDRNGKECHICTRVYTGFRWKPGPRARYKLTIICQQCARLKNVCQTCLFDLEYGLPVQVRDKILNDINRVAIPDHPVNREYLNSRGHAAVAPTAVDAAKANEAADLLLRSIARTAPYYKRNLPRVCTFWRKGACTRGDECPYLHEELYTDPSLANQNIRDRYVGQDDPVAAKILRSTDKPKSNAAPSWLPPSDPSITTLFVGGLTAVVREQQLLDHLSKFGEILAVRMQPQKAHAFVCFEKRASAEAAMEHLKGQLQIGGAFLRVGWARPRKTDGASASGEAKMEGGGTSESKNAISSASSSYVPSPIPGLPPLPLPQGLCLPSPADSGAPYKSMRPREAELARQ